MTMNETLKVIEQRRSIRNFKDEQIKEDELQAIVAAGQYAPYADEERYFTVIQSENMLDRLNLAAKEAARMTGIEHLAQLGSNEKFNCLYGAPTLIIVSASEHGVCPDVDCAATIQNMLIAAESVGLGSCWIYFVLQAFFSSQGNELRKELGILDGFKPCASVALGYKKTSSVVGRERKLDNVTFVR